MTMAIQFAKATSSIDIPLEIKHLYHSAFPEEERRDWADICRRIDTGDPIFDFYVLQHNSEVCGFATMWKLPGTLYCEHFAIFPRFRNMGLGSATVKEMLSMAGENPFVIEVELPDVSFEAMRRVHFYKDCGMIPLENFPYWQPPYRRDLPEVAMMLMSSKPLSDPASFVIMLHTIVYNQ